MEKKIETKKNKIYFVGKINKTSMTILKAELLYNKNGYNRAFSFNIKALGVDLRFSINVYRKTFTSQYCYAIKGAR